jgi:hypothetical protein
MPVLASLGHAGYNVKVSSNVDPSIGLARVDAVVPSVAGIFRSGGLYEEWNQTGRGRRSRWELRLTIDSGPLAD